LQFYYYSWYFPKFLYFFLHFQEPYFHWTFGVSEPDCYGLIQVSSGKTYLFFPRIDETHIVWLGKPLTLDEYKCRYKVEDVLFVDMVIKHFLSF